MARFALAFVVVLLSGSCGGGGDAASVSIASPDDGATVESPFSVTMEAQGFTIERAGGVRDGAGHFHLMVDVDCLSPGGRIPEDGTHRHLADGSSETELALEPGEHTLCLQAGNGAHEALDLTHEITITVAGSQAATQDEVWEGTIDSTVTSVGGGAGPCGSPVHVEGPVRLVVAGDGTVTGTYDVAGCLVSEPHGEFMGTASDDGFLFPQLIVQTNGELVSKVSPTQARATLNNFQGAGGVGAQWSTAWMLTCKTC